jgi:gliding motility-associated-like protein/uncharacterized repeat protein (TIGR01451 family)
MTFPKANFGQAPALGNAANFELYTTVGAITNTGISFITGDVGSNSGSSTGFGNVNGNMNDGTPASAACSTDLLLAYAQMNSAVATFFPAPLLGNGQILNAGVYSIAAPATLNGTLILDGQGNANAVFIFKIQAAFSTNTLSKVRLINGALACNVFWKVEGLVSMSAGTSMKGTIVANNAAIAMSAGDTLEGRALSINGAITLNGLLGYTPIGCNSPNLTGPPTPPLGTTACYEIFSSDGAVTNSGVTHIIGDVGTNLGSVVGFLPLDVTGAIHAVPDGSTGQCATDLGVLYTFLNTLPTDILLLYPAQFGHNLVLTPHTYHMNGATSFTDTLYLNAEGKPNAEFVIQIKGAFSTSTFSNVVLINGAQAKNVFWCIDGAVDINAHSIFNGTIICNNGAINLQTGVVLNGGAFTTTGALSTFAITAGVTTGSGPAGAITGPSAVCAGQVGVIYSVAPVSNATTYTWTVPAGVTITKGATTDSITVSFGAGASSGNITVSGGSSCGSGLVSANFAVTVNPLPGAAGLITGPNSVCQGQSGAVYTVPAIANATGYNWTLPAGATITTGVNTNTITISFSPTATGDSIIVEGKNSCGVGPSSAQFIILINTLPSPSGSITGTSSVCPGQTGVGYSVPVIANASGYNWTLPAGASISAGLNTNAITVDFSLLAVSGNITVAGTSGCGNGTTATFAVKVNASGAAGTITGPPVVCAGQVGVIYSVPPILNATTYVWTLPAGATITNGSTTDSITVSFGTGASSGNIAVSGVSSCGSGPISANFAVSVNPLPGAAGLITGPPSVCQGQSGAVYSVPAIANATGYNWTLPSGAIITTGMNTNTFTVTFSPTAAGDTIIVEGTNACGVGPASAKFIITVNTLPPTPGAITGTSSVCPGQTGVIYSVPAVAGATGYSWTLPAGASITAGLNTNSITVSFSLLAVSGNISVAAINGCGTGTFSANFAVNINTPFAAGTITGPTPVCPGQTGAIYSVPLITNASGYNWTLPSGASISAGLNTNSITVDFSLLAVSGNITVEGTSVCGNGTPSANFAVVVSGPTGAAGPISGSPTTCNGQTSVIYSVTAIANATGYIWTVPAGATITAGLNTNSITVSYPAVAVGGNVTVQGTNNCGNGTVSANFAVAVNPTPTTNIVSNQTVCNGASTNAVVFGGTVAGTTFDWINSMTSIGLGANGTGNIPAFTATDTSTSANVATINVTPSAGGCTGSTTSFTITVNPSPRINPVSNQQVCANTATAAVIFSSGGPAGTVFSWTNDSTSIGLVASGNGNIPSFMATNSGNVAISSQVTITASANGCNGAPISFLYVVKPIPMAKATSNSPVCLGSTIDLSALLVARATYSWTGPNGYSSSAENSLITSATALDAGTYTLTVILNGCTSAPSFDTIVTKNCASSNLSVTKTASNTRPIVGSKIVFTITALNNGPSSATGVAVNEVLQSGFSYVSSTATSGTYDPNTGVWTIGTMANGESDVLSITALVLAGGNYVNTVVIYSNEPDPILVDNTISIEVFPTDFNIPEGFSPNADGINDEFVIRGLDSYPNNTFVIFNRWGDQVFEASPYQNNWAGKCAKGITVGGDVLPVGTYFYVLDLKDGSPIYKGTIYLNK